MVGSWPEEQHLRMLADPGVVYIAAEDLQGQIAAFAILQGLGSEHRAVELKRLVVGVPNQGLGRKLLREVAERTFGEYGAHRLVLDVFVTNDRARHVYETFGFRDRGHHAGGDLSRWGLPFPGPDVIVRERVSEEDLMRNLMFAFRV